MACKPLTSIRNILGCACSRPRTATTTSSIARRDERPREARDGTSRLPGLRCFPPQAPAVRRGHRSADRQAEAESGGLGREERLEYSISRVDREANAGIDDRDLETIGAYTTDAKLQDAVRDGSVGHRFASVDDKVHEQLQQLNLVAAHRWQSGRDIRVHAHVCVRRGLAGQGERIVHDRFQRDRLAP